MSGPAWRVGLRDLLVAFHLIGVTLMAFPAPTGARSEKVWKEAYLGRQIAAWTRPLVALGFDLTPARSAEIAKRAAFAYLDVRDVIVAPFQPYTRLCGTSQSWHMFGSVNPEPGRIQAELEIGGAWRTVYRARDPELDWLADKLDQERMRAAANPWSWGLSKTTYKGFCRWLGAEAKRDYPDATQIRCAILRAKLPEPAALRAGQVEPERETWVETLALDGIEAAP